MAAARHSGDGGEIPRQLAEAQAAAQRMNCMGGGLFGLFGPPPAPACGAVMASIRRLQARSAPPMFGGFFQPNPAALREELRANGCEVPDGQARTICVRSCDGYYFPISFSAPRSRWKVDAETCQSMYGTAGQAELYAHSVEGDVADARSLTGKRYGDQAFAFLYRNTTDKACASQLSTGMAALAARYLARKPLRPTAPAAAYTPVPQPRPDDAEDPETVANRAGDFTVGSYSPPAPHTVRHVGPAYYAEVYTTRPLEREPSWFEKLFGLAKAADAPAAAISVSQAPPVAR